MTRHTRLFLRPEPASVGLLAGLALVAFACGGDHEPDDHGTIEAELGTNPTGHLDVVDENGRVAGWACDQDAPTQSISVHVYVGGSFAGALTADKPSEQAVNDICGGGTAHRFDGTIAALEPGGVAQVYGINLGGGVNAEIGGSPKTAPATCPGCSVNFAASGAAVQSSTYASSVSYSAGRALDGDASTFQNSNSQYRPWWRVDLGVPRRVHTITGWNRASYGGRTNDYWIFADPNDCAFDDAYVVANVSGAAMGRPQTWTFSTRDVRCVALQLKDTNYLNVAEIEVIGVADCRTDPSSCITWQNAANVVSAGNSLRRPVTSSGWNGGASSAETLEGDGYMEFSVAETNTYRMAGLGAGDASQSYADIDYAVYPAANGTVYVYENGTGRGSFGSYAPGDRFRVEVSSGTVSYKRNGTTFYTSTVPAPSSLRVDTSFYSGMSVGASGAAIQDVALVALGAVCGNGVVESGEECDGGACCTATCSFVAEGTSCDGGSCQADADGEAVCTGHLIAFQDPDEPTPQGWSCISCSPGDPLYQRFPVGDASAGSQGGSTTHTHAATVGATSASSGTRGFVGSDTWSGVDTLSNDGHTHGSNTGSTYAAEHVPPYRNLKVLQADSDTRVLPAGAIVLLDTATIPADFERYTAQDGYFIRGAGSSGTGGAPSHAHGFDVETSPSCSGWNTAGDNQQWGATSCHTHTVSGTTDEASNEPKHARVVLARVTDPDGVVVPQGAILPFLAAPPEDFTPHSSAGGNLAGDFLKASTTPNFSDFGADNHGHGDTGSLTTGPSNLNVLARGPNTAIRASEWHTHTASVSFVPSENRPPFTTVILAKRTSMTYLANGDACLLAAECGSSNCVDGVCCDTACADDCGACNIAGSEGTCTALAAGTVCRDAAGTCDAAESCDGLALTCPEDVGGNPGAVCRPAVGACDVAETCDGVEPSCPADAGGNAGAVCYAAAGPCEADGVCDGVSPTCPGGVLVAGTICNWEDGSTCDGTSTSCPTEMTPGVTTYRETCGL